MARVRAQLCKLQKRVHSRLAAASDKVYQLLAHGRWFSPGTPASSTTKTGRHWYSWNIAESGVKHQKSIKSKRTSVIFGLLSEVINCTHSATQATHVVWFSGYMCSFINIFIETDRNKHNGKVCNKIKERKRSIEYLLLKWEINHSCRKYSIPPLSEHLFCNEKVAL